MISQCQWNNPALPETYISWWRQQMETFPRYRPFVRGIHQSPVNSLHKGQWRGVLMFSLIYRWTNGWVNNRDADDLWRHRARYDVTIMWRTWIELVDPKLQQNTTKHKPRALFLRRSISGSYQSALFSTVLVGTRSSAGAWLIFAYVPADVFFSGVYFSIFDGQTFLQMAAAISRDMRVTLMVKSGDGGISRI